MGKKTEPRTKIFQQLFLWDTLEQDTVNAEEKNNEIVTPESTASAKASSNSSKQPVGTKPKAKTTGASKPKQTAVTPTAVQKIAPLSRPKVRRPFPQNALEDALAVSQAIKEKNNGKPLEPEQVAKACNNVSHTSTKFFYLAASSRDYGLTNGSRDTETISLTDLGQSIV